MDINITQDQYTFLIASLNTVVNQLKKAEGADVSELITIGESTIELFSNLTNKSDNAK